MRIDVILHIVKCSSLSGKGCFLERQKNTHKKELSSYI